MTDDNDDNVIPFKAYRDVKAPARVYPRFVLRGFQDGIHLEYPGRPWTTKELYQISNDLRFMARTIQAKASAEDGEPDEIVGDLQIYASGTGRVWLADTIGTEEQRAWVMRQIDFARDLVPGFSNLQKEPSND